MVGTGACGEFVPQGFRIKLAVAPRNFTVIDRFVEDTEIMEGSQETAADSYKQIAFKNQIVVAESKNIRLVTTIRSCREAKKKTGSEVLEQAPVHRCCGVMEFIDDDVIEMRCDKLLQMLYAA